MYVHVEALDIMDTGAQYACITGHYSMILEICIKDVCRLARCRNDIPLIFHLNIMTLYAIESATANTHATTPTANRPWLAAVSREASIQNRINIIFKNNDF